MTKTNEYKVCFLCSCGIIKIIAHFQCSYSSTAAQPSSNDIVQSGVLELSRRTGLNLGCHLQHHHPRFHLSIWMLPFSLGITTPERLEPL